MKKAILGKQRRLKEETVEESRVEEQRGLEEQRGMEEQGAVDPRDCSIIELIRKEIPRQHPDVNVNAILIDFS